MKSPPAARASIPAGRSVPFARPVLPMLIALMGGILLGAYLPDHPHIFRITAGLSGLWMLARLATGRRARISPLLLIASLGCLSVAPFLTSRLPPEHVMHHADNRTRWRITGVVLNEPRPASNNRLRFKMRVLRMEHTSSKNTSQPSTIDDRPERQGIVRITLYGGDPDIGKGDRIVLTARLKPIRNFKNPGGFDYRRYMAFRGVRASANVRPGDILSLEKTDTGLFRPNIDRRRARSAQWIAHHMKGEPLAVMQALVIGERSGITPELRERFSRSGAGHLLAISGLHIGIVVLLTFRTSVRGLSFITPLLWNAWPRKIAALLAIAAAIAYGLLAGMSPSTQRAVIMACLFLGAFVFRRESDGLNAVFTAALVILIVHPPALFSISFQLSFAAVTAIVHGFPKIVKPAPEPGGRSRIRAMAGRTAKFMLVSILAILGVTPLIMFYFGEISLIGVLLNLVMIPLIGFVAVPAGLLALLTAPVCEPAALLFLKIGDIAIQTGLSVIDLSLKLPFAHLRTFSPTLFEIGLYYGILAALLNLRANHRPVTARPHPAPGPAWRPRAIAALIILLAAAIGDGLYWRHERFGRQDLRITVLDVGHGAAALLELPGGETMLIDGGGFASNEWFDMGRQVIAPFLRRKKILTVDRLVLTHPDADHLNGLLFIADRFHVREAWTTRETAATMGYREWMRILAEQRIDHPPWEELAGSTRQIQGVAFTFLYPPPDFLETENTRARRSANDNSMVLKVGFGDTAFLFPGDIMRRGERELVPQAGPALRSTVMLAPHHGSNTSSTTPLIQTVDPVLVIFSVDEDNRFGMPRRQVLDRYEKAGVPSLGTHLDGAVIMVSDGRQVRLRTFRGLKKNLLPSPPRNACSFGSNDTRIAVYFSPDFI